MIPVIQKSLKNISSNKKIFLLGFYYSTLIAALLLRHISIVLTAVVILILLVLILSNLPISIKFFQEQDDSIEKMTFYAILCLGIIVSLVYWGGL